MHYTNREDRIILECVNDDPGNITRAIEKAALQIPYRSLTSLNQRFYRKLRNANKNIAVASKSGVIALGKNQPRSNDKLNVIISLSIKLSKKEIKDLMLILFDKL